MWPFDTDGEAEPVPEPEEGEDSALSKKELVKGLIAAVSNPPQANS